MEYDASVECRQAIVAAYQAQIAKVFAEIADNQIPIGSRVVAARDGISQAQDTLDAMLQAYSIVYEGEELDEDEELEEEVA